MGLPLKIHGLGFRVHKKAPVTAPAVSTQQIVKVVVQVLEGP